MNCIVSIALSSTACLQSNRGEHLKALRTLRYDVCAALLAALFVAVVTGCAPTRPSEPNYPREPQMPEALTPPKELPQLEPPRLVRADLVSCGIRWASRGREPGSRFMDAVIDLTPTLKVTGLANRILVVSAYLESGQSSQLLGWVECEVGARDDEAVLEVPFSIPARSVTEELFFRWMSKPTLRCYVTDPSGPNGYLATGQWPVSWNGPEMFDRLVSIEDGTGGSLDSAFLFSYDLLFQGRSGQRFELWVQLFTEDDRGKLVEHGDALRLDQSRIEHDPCLVKLRQMGIQRPIPKLPPDAVVVAGLFVKFEDGRTQPLRSNFLSFMAGVPAAN